MIEGSLTLHPSASHGGARVADLGAEPAHARGLAGLSGERDQAGNDTCRRDTCQAVMIPPMFSFVEMSLSKSHGRCYGNAGGKLGFLTIS